MLAKNSLKSANILLADNDSGISLLVARQLRAMGFKELRRVTNGVEALKVIRSEQVHLLITEWNLFPTNGIELIDHIRHWPSASKRTLPIIMLTGRGERADVHQARDAGINEFIVKPFSVNTLYKRIEQVIDHPRRFVVSNDYVGPERRRQQALPAGMKDRRSTIPQSVPPGLFLDHDNSNDHPTLVDAEYTIKHAIGLDAPLASVITEEMLKEAENIIDTMKDDFLLWVKRDLRDLEVAYDWSSRGMHPVESLEQAKTAALSIKSRSGVFGYYLASDVARLLYLFLCTDYNADRPVHNCIFEQHISALKVTLANKLDKDSPKGRELLSELQRVIQI